MATTLLNIGGLISSLLLLIFVNSIKNTVVCCHVSVSKNFEFLMIILLTSIISFQIMIPLSAMLMIFMITIEASEKTLLSIFQIASNLPYFI